MSGPRLALLVVPDLFFVARITTTAAHLGVETRSSTPQRLAADARERRPDLVLVDLHGAGALEAVRALKADAALAGVHVVGFYSHVDAALRAAALAAGVDAALPRSAFTVKLAGLLAGEH